MPRQRLFYGARPCAWCSNCKPHARAMQLCNVVTAVVAALMWGGRDESAVSSDNVASVRAVAGAAAADRAVPLRLPPVFVPPNTSRADDLWAAGRLAAAFTAYVAPLGDLLAYRRSL